MSESENEQSKNTPDEKNDEYTHKNKIAYRRVKTPTIIQMEATECGAICLAIILAYYKKFISIETLRISCGISRDGSNALNVLQAAITYDLDAKGYSRDTEELDDIQLPAILFWKFEHFVVLEGFGKNGVFINDPATGPKIVAYEDFEQAYTGVVITLSPTSAFVKEGKPPSITEALFQRLRNVKAPIFYVILTGICLLIPNLAFPAFTQVFIDQVLIKRVLSWKIGLICGMLLAVAASGILTFLQGNILNRLNARLSLRFASDAIWHMLRLPISFYTQRYPGEIAYRLVLNDSISRTITGHLAGSIVNVLFAFVYGIAMLHYDVIITLTSVSVIFLNLFLMHFVYRSWSDAYACYQADLGKSNAYALGGLENIETLKATGTEFKFFSRFAGQYTKVINSLQTAAKKNILLSLFTPFLSSLSILVLIGVGGWRIINGHLTIGMFVALQILMRNFMDPVMELINFSQSIQLLKVDMARLDDISKNPIDPLFENENDAQTAAKGEKEDAFAKLKGYVELRNVTFSYSPLDQPILKEITLSLNPGKSVALVGVTGCGKSSIAKLIGGLFYPNSGQILIDGMERKEIPRRRIVNSLSLIEQEPFMFSGSVKDNLTLLDPTIAQEDVFRAAKDACIHDEILARSGGYDLQIEENGSNLSGGQRQRFEIARGLTKNPTILIMDESTSALDSDTEAEVIKNIRRRGCALLMIAHRLSTIRNCDEIIVIDKGEIVASGTHEELKAIPGIYRELVESENL